MMQINIFHNFFHVRGNRLAYSQKQRKICYHQDIKKRREVIALESYRQCIKELVDQIHNIEDLKKLYALADYYCNRKEKAGS